MRVTQRKSRGTSRRDGTEFIHLGPEQRQSRPVLLAVLKQKHKNEIRSNNRMEIFLLWNNS